MNNTIDVPGSLSQRGQSLASGNDSTEVFEIVRNLYDPITNPTGYVSLGIAENDLMHEALIEHIESNFKLASPYLTYFDGGAGSRRLTVAISQFLNRWLNPVVPIAASQIVVTNGTSTAIESLAYCLTAAGDGILLGRPYYRAFLPDLTTRTGAEVLKVSFGDVDPFSVDGVKCYEDVILDAYERGQPVKMLMLCHPHNPLGRCYPKKTLVALMRLCEKYQIHLVSDEIYALSVWENRVDHDDESSSMMTPFVSALSIPTEEIISPHLLHFIWGMSKDFGANGLRIGCAISQSNPSLIGALTTLSLYSYPSNVADYITSTILEDDDFTDRYIKENRDKLASRFSVAARYLTDNGIEYARGVNSAFFIYADLGSAYLQRRTGYSKPDQKTSIRDEERKGLSNLLYKRLLAKRVFLVDGDAMGSEQEGWFRIVFTQGEEYLLEGLKRIVAAVEEDVNNRNENVKKEEVDLVERPKMIGANGGTAEKGVIGPVAGMMT